MNSPHPTPLSTNLRSAPGEGTLRSRLAITVRGVVQGVGFRPFVYQAARARGLTGWVKNEADTVRIEVCGDRAALDAFVDALRRDPPPQARVEAVDVEEKLPAADAELGVFRIRGSTAAAAPRPTIPADLATCSKCLNEIRDPGQRRCRYPFTNCTHCGPRWSIIERLPYDRPRTSMAGFAMCAECRAEYEDPSDRRFHAQPIACPNCGPTLQLLDGEGRETAIGENALTGAVQAVLSGRIAAIKGLGGFQLIVDATDAEAVARLRRRKRRPDRPFALMLPSLDVVRQYCDVSDEEAKALSSPPSPIVLLRRRVPPFSLALADGVAPGNPRLGVMLPYTPLHHLLMTAVARPIVCTSGNLSEEPMATAAEDALVRLGPIADVLLTHNRPIVRPVDDSIVRFGPGGLQVLRRARGFAPLPISLTVASENTPTILAVGGHLKNTVALALGTDTSSPPKKAVQVVMSAHVGDLDSAPSVDVFHRAIDDLLAFFHAVPDAVVCDLHPDYASTRRAERLAAQWDVPLLRVQHHHAHVAACMAEHGLRGPALGFAWDGAGYGPDGTVWGGEALFCEGAAFRRMARLRTFALPGGDRAMHEPWRSALGVLFEILGERAAERASDWFTAGELDSLLSMLTGRFHAPRTSSMGRLFDAVTALCGLSTVVTYEGQAAMALEFAADEREEDAYPLPVSGDAGRPRVVDWAPLIRSVLADRAAGAPVERIAARFHNALAEMAVAIARLAMPAGGPIVLTGGCFQNLLLTTRTCSRLSAAGFQVYTHHSVPPGDGGLALGQVFLALQQGQGSFDVSWNSR